MEGTHIISMDAIFGLCRKKSAGESHRSPLLSGVFFEEQEGVDQFVENYDSSDKIMDKVCDMYTPQLLGCMHTDTVRTSVYVLCICSFWSGKILEICCDLFFKGC